VVNPECFLLKWAAGRARRLAHLGLFFVRSRDNFASYFSANGQNYYKMLRQIFAILLFLQLLPTGLGAQNASLETFDREGIYLRNEFWRGTVFVKNGQVKSVGFAYKNLRPEFERTPGVMPMFKKAQRNEKISFAVGLLGLAGITAGTIIAMKSIDSQGYLINERQFRRGLNIIQGSTVAAIAINIPLQFRSRQQLDDAIWLRNRTLLEN
jgi:hypothetical protein